MLPGEVGFTTNELTGTVGQVVSYEIIVTNVGNVSLSLSNFTDTQCVGIGGGAPELAPGDFTIYTCMHIITSVTPYANVAAVEGTPPPGQGAPVRAESNMVVVKAVAPTGQVIPEKTTKPPCGLRGRARHARAERRGRAQAPQVHASRSKRTASSRSPSSSTGARSRPSPLRDLPTRSSSR